MWCRVLYYLFIVQDNSTMRNSGLSFDEWSLFLCVSDLRLTPLFFIDLGYRCHSAIIARDKETIGCVMILKYAYIIIAPIGIS